MKHFVPFFILLIGIAHAQFTSTTTKHLEYKEMHPDKVSEGEFLGKTISISAIKQETAASQTTRVVENFKTRGTVGPIEFNPNPQVDPVWRESAPFTRSKTPTNTLVYNANGIGYQNVQPPDPVIEVGPNHVVQMVNSSSGTRMTVLSKTGTVIQAPSSINSLWNSVNANGLGDPIVLYDRNTNRWFITEFASSGNRLLVAASTSASPTGSYNAYAFNTTNFPDYPKYAVWDNALTVTTNENSSRVYALDKAALLAAVRT